jgi:2-polyprenyl-6-hydroxyphenyl methylase/3-demethylubiquinone-9 3-methyltransferase
MNEIAQQHSREVSSGTRFEFGKNWRKFLELLDEERIAKAEQSLREMLEFETLEGKTFLDIGSGSGLFSLAARRLGAKVFSFDYDTDSVACTSELRRRFFENDADWRVEQGSVLDKKYLESLGKFDIVYSWGVLHHTGDMWKALENAGTLVAEKGKLFIAIYNDTGTQSRRWLAIKKLYNRVPRFLRTPMTILVFIPQELKRFFRGLFKLKPLEFFREWKNYKNSRGMNLWYDMVDWIGGYPYEFATPDEIFEFYKAKSYRLTKLKVGRVGLGCNEFVFEKES